MSKKMPRPAPFAGVMKLPHKFHLYLIIVGEFILRLFLTICACWEISRLVMVVPVLSSDTWYLSREVSSWSYENGSSSIHFNVHLKSKSLRHLLWGVGIFATHWLSNSYHCSRDLTSAPRVFIKCSLNVVYFNQLLDVCTTRRWPKYFFRHFLV